MYKCFNCGAVFEDVITVTDERGAVSGCPQCGADDLAIVDQCPDCGAYYESGDLFGGLCLHCLKERIDYPTALSYLLARDSLREFLTTVDGDYARTGDQHALLMAYLTHEIEDRNWGSEEFLNKLRDYILDDAICAVDFSTWLTGEEG